MKPSVLFVCFENRARSQMAEGWLKHLAGDRYTVHSAGMNPAEQVHPMAVEAMKEVGIDISDQTPHSTQDYLGKLPVTYLVIVCGKAEKHCPRVWPGIRMRFFWQFSDPAAIEGSDAAKMEAFRDVRDQIKARIENWLSEIEEPTSDTATTG